MKFGVYLWIYPKHLIRYGKKLRQNETSGNLLNILEESQRNRKQRVVINGQASDWEKNHAGVPQKFYPGITVVLNSK